MVISHAFAAQRELPSHDDLGRPLHVAGEVWHRHATLATLLVTTCLHNLGVQQHDQTVASSGLRMRRDVDTERLGGYPHLGRGETHAAR